MSNVNVWAWGEFWLVPRNISRIRIEYGDVPEPSNPSTEWRVVVDLAGGFSQVVSRHVVSYRPEPGRNQEARMEAIQRMNRLAEMLEEPLT